MARPKAAELTDRELAVMQVFWQQDEATAEDVRQRLAESGETLAYVTVANVVRGLADKGFLEQTWSERPYRYRAIRTFDEVSGRLIGDFVDRLFEGSRESMLVHLLSNRKLTGQERRFLREVLGQIEQGGPDNE